MYYEINKRQVVHKISLEDAFDKIKSAKGAYWSDNHIQGGIAFVMFDGVLDAFQAELACIYDAITIY